MDQLLQSKDRSQLADSNITLLECTCGKEWERPATSGEKRGYRYYQECWECGLHRRTERFTKTCPSLYQKTDATRLPVAQLKKALAWKYSGRGLILLGETGVGKTRVAWTLLRRVLIEDHVNLGFAWFDGVQFGHDIGTHYRADDAEDWLERTAKTALLFFDDLGKLKLTERAETELFGLIERRCANELPIIVTTNDTGDSLAARMTDNRGPALVRRLREFCEPIQF